MLRVARMCQFQRVFSSLGTKFLRDLKQPNHALKVSFLRALSSDSVNSHAHQAKDEKEAKIPRSIGITPGEQRRLSRLRPEQPEQPRCLKVAVIGAPNGGKSTLANKLMGWRFTSVSEKVHTTRARTLGVLTEEDTQVIFLDTPGMTTPSKVKKHKLNKELLTHPHSTLFEADLIAVVADVSTVWGSTSIDAEVLKALYLHRDKPSVLILNKIDRVKHKKNLLKFTRILTEGKVAGRSDSYTEKKDKDMDFESLFDNMTRHNSQNQTELMGHRGPFVTDSNFAREDMGDLLSEYETVSYHNPAADEPMGDRSDVAESHEGQYSQDTSSVPGISPNTEDLSSIDWHQHLASTSRVVSALDHDQRSQSFGEGPEMQTQESQEIPPPAAVNSKEFPEIPENIEMSDMPEWVEYYRKLNKAHSYTLRHKGWPHFSEVFMISALEGNGVWQLKRHLLEIAPLAPWLYNSAMVTDQDPIELARLCVWEKVMDHLPKEIPYQITVRVSVWEVDDQGLLHTGFDLICDRKRQLSAALGKGGQTIRQIAIDAKQELMNTFQTELSLKIAIRSKEEESLDL